MAQIDDRGLIVSCPSCQQRNRVPFGHGGAQSAKCKKCGTLLPAAAEPMEVPSADVFDALTQKRPYKPAWPVEDAIAEIERQRGLQFDPNIVEAFLRVVQQQLAS